MARITVEDCLGSLDNRFDLVMLATKRARQLSNGVDPMVEWRNDKPTVVALREIAEGVVDNETVRPAEEPVTIEVAPVPESVEPEIPPTDS